MINLYQPPTPVFTAAVGDPATYFAIPGVGAGGVLAGPTPQVAATISVETSSSPLNILVIQGRVTEDDPWVDMAVAQVDVLSDYVETFLIQPLPFMRAGWAFHAEGASSGVVVRLTASVRERRP
jgi:hypothetical protein